MPGVDQIPTQDESEVHWEGNEELNKKIVKLG